MMRAAALALLLIGAPVWADGTFCWDPVPGATWYHLYSAEIMSEWVVVDPETGEGYCTTAAPIWNQCNRVDLSSQNCGATRCCAFVVDRPADVVFYFMSADTDLTPGGRESLTRPMEVCP